jgi:signal transduction histidine kinase
LRVARDLHDGVSQLIAAAKVKLSTVQHTIAASSPAAGEIVTRCNGLIVQALEENRRVAHNLRPSDLDDFGLIIACRNLCKEFRLRTGTRVLCRTKGFDVRLPPTMELNLFRIVQEALNNIEKHAQAKSVGIGFSIRNDLLVLEIRDNGRGFNSKVSVTRRRKRRGMGLSNIHERAVLLGGTSTVESGRAKGTSIVVQVPLAASP